MVHRFQTEILTKAKELHPTFRLKNWSEKTGIQLTRIFRIFHGKEMSLHEYMSFQAFLNTHHNLELSNSYDDFIKFSNQGLEHLPKPILDQITLNIKYHLENFFLLQGKIQNQERNL